MREQLRKKGLSQRREALRVSLVELG